MNERIRELVKQSGGEFWQRLENDVVKQDAYITFDPPESLEKFVMLVIQDYKNDVRETPYNIGKRHYREGLGISGLWGAVENDNELAEAQRGYDDAQAKDLARKDLKEIKSKLGYSRIGRNNV